MKILLLMTAFSLTGEEQLSGAHPETFETFNECNRYVASFYMNSVNASNVKKDGDSWIIDYPDKSFIIARCAAEEISV